MAYLAREIIKNKREGLKNKAEEIHWLIHAYTQGTLPDYQMSAWLMSVFFRGLDSTESAALTHSMLHSGVVLDLSGISKPKVDKHSTGGVGDKTSLIIAPLVASFDLCVPMMAGRGLGHTGGTLDKLEAIPGFQVGLSLEQFQKQLREFGTAIIGQTAEICPADKKIYALRDVTATIEIIPVICASIMSKKIAEGIDSLVLDVKFGSGAFMKTFEQAKILAQALQSVGSMHGKKVSTFLTNMSQVLGQKVGNALEVEECEDIMRDPTSHKRYFDTVELTLKLAGEMLVLGEKAKTLEEGIGLARKHLENGTAYEWWQKMCHLQGGNLKALPKAKFVMDVFPKQKGFVEQIHTEAIGIAGILLGAGRKTWDDKIDPTTGFEVFVKTGDAVAPDIPLAKIHAKDKIQAETVLDMLRNAFQITEGKIDSGPLIQEILHAK